MIGYPIFPAAAFIAFKSESASSVPGTVGTPVLTANFFRLRFVPKRLEQFRRRPHKLIPFFTQARARSAFSAKNP